jgi:hypothetical protein
MHEQRDDRQLHLAPFDLAAEIFRAAPDHLAGEEDANDQEQQEIDHADALAAEHAVQPHACEGRQARHRIERVVLGVDCAARHVGRDDAEYGTRRRAEAQLLAFEVAEMLVHGQAGDRGHSDRAPAARRGRIRPYISTSVNGKIIIAKVVTKFDSAVGFSSGTAEFMP